MSAITVFAKFITENPYEIKVLRWASTVLLQYEHITSRQSNQLLLQTLC